MKNIMKKCILDKFRLFFLIFHLLFILSLLSCDKENASEYTDILPSYLQADLEQNVNSYIDSLTSIKFAGRRVGTIGGEYACEYLIRELLLMNHQVVIQPFRIKSNIKANNIIVPVKGRTKKTIIIGAHYDGPIESNSMTHYPNANDNASGTAALLALAKILSYSNCTFDYTLLLCFWDGEEYTNGSILSGSSFFTNSMDLSSVSCYINIDGVGTDDGSKSINLYANKKFHFTFLSDLFQTISPNEINISLLLEDSVKTNLDTYPFYKAGVPYIYWTNPSDLHQFNHTPQDTAGLVSDSKIVSIAECSYIIINNFED